MNPTVVVLHKGSLAYHTISKAGGCSFAARLLKYQGNLVDTPPHHFILHKDGRHWCSQGTGQELLDEVGFALEFSDMK